MPSVKLLAEWDPFCMTTIGQLGKLLICAIAVEAVDEAQKQQIDVDAISRAVAQISPKELGQIAAWLR